MVESVVDIVVGTAVFVSFSLHKIGKLLQLLTDLHLNHFKLTFKPAVLALYTFCLRVA